MCIRDSVNGDRFSDPASDLMAVVTYNGELKNVFRVPLMAFYGVEINRCFSAWLNWITFGFFFTLLEISGLA